MPSSQWITGRNRDFRGGETQAALPEEVGRNQLLRMENAMLFPTGEITASHQADTPMVTGATLGLAVVPFTDGTYNVFSAPDNGNVYGQFLDTSSGAPVDMPAGSQTAVAGARIVGVHRAVKFLGKHYCPNPNVDDTKDGILNLTDFALVNVAGSTATALKLRRYANRLWLISSDGTLRNSDNGDATTWNALNIMLLANSEPIIDFHPVQGGVIVYSATAIYAMYGTVYSDITFIPLIESSVDNPKQFTSGSVEIAGVVYILSTEGIYQTTLNGAQLVPHHQERFFKECFSIFSDPAKTVTAVYMQAFRAILFTWPEVYGISQSLVFYLTGAYSKINRLLPTAYPYIVAMNDANTDYMVALSEGVLAKSEYPSANMTEAQPSYIQTRHEDADSYRDKVWSAFTIVTGQVVYGVTVQAYLDESTTPVLVADAVGLSKGENTFWLDDLDRSKTISMLITIDNSAVLTLVSDDDSTMILTDDDGDELVATINPGNWSIKELRLRYREAGPAI